MVMTNVSQNHDSGLQQTSCRHYYSGLLKFKIYCSDQYMPIAHTKMEKKSNQCHNGFIFWQNFLFIYFLYFRLLDHGVYFQLQKSS